MNLYSKSTLLLIFIFSLLSLSKVKAKQNDCAIINICTFNIRADKATDNINIWDNRKDSVVKIIRSYNFDIIGFQEVTEKQYQDLLTMNEYRFVGQLGRVNGSYRSVAYKTDRFELLDENTFGINETGEPGVPGWDALYERACTWIKVKEKHTGVTFCVFNIHLDHKGKIAQKEGAVFVNKEAKKIAENLPYVIMGDMNVTAESEAYKTFSSNCTDARKISERTPKGPLHTFHSWGKVARQIDFIFVSNKIKVQSFQTIDESYANGLYPSDHYPVSSKLRIKR